MRRASFYINGIKKDLVCHEDKSLLDVIRSDFGLTGTKRECDQQGYCGACSIIMDGKAVRSCQITMKNVPDDTQIVTIEGIGTLSEPHPIQKAFAYAGAIQCGFCTPGMIITAKALLDKNPNPGEAEIRSVFKGNLCRCTGYSSIIRAVQLAGKLMSGEIKEADIKVDTSKGTFGKYVPRPDSLAKATGATQFGDDIPMPSDTLHLKVVRSPFHHAIIKFIDTLEAEKMPGVVGVITAKDIPGTNRLGGGQTIYYTKFVPNERILCNKKVSEWGAAVAVVVAETVEQAAAAADSVKVEYEFLPGYNTPQESLASEAISIVPEYNGNLVFTGYLKKGVQNKAEAEKALETSDVVVSQSFVTSRQPMLFNEPENATAFLDENGCLTIMSKTISVHANTPELSRAVGIDPSKVRWIENPAGGLFGAKGSFSCECFVALAVMKYRRPCKIVYTMAESILTTGKRSRVWVKAKIGATKDGHINSLVYDLDLDCGAYDSHGSSLVNKCHNYIGGPHNIPLTFGEGRVVLTNNNRGTTCGRGLGATQIQCVSDVLIDKLAEKLGIDPLEFRYRNAWKEGNIGNWGGKLDCYPYPAMLERLRPLYQAAKEKARKENSGQKKRGVGIGAAFFGCGIDDMPDCSAAWVELNPDNGVTVYASWADPGQGGDIGILTVASKAMGDLSPEKIRVVSRDSSLTPNSGRSVASRQTYVTGNAIRLACESLLKAMQDNQCRDYAGMAAKGVPLKYEGKYVCRSIVTCDDNCQGKPVENWSYNLQMAEVEVDIKTGKVDVLKMTTILDAGVIHNPIAVEGQAEGGANMGVGFALWEDFKSGETDTLIKGGIPNFTNSPAIECLYNETFRQNGTYGGVGCGEVVMMGAAPAVLNAIYDACGVRIDEIPAKPGVVLAAIRNKENL